MELVSIIIPVYNAERYLAKCIQSCINQTYQQTEIILADDGSEDDSGRICDEYASKYRKVKAYHKKNSGVSDTRNFGISVSEGTYIMFADADDWLAEIAVESMVHAAQDSGAGLVAAGMSLYDHSGIQILEHFYLEEKTYKNANIARTLFSRKENFLYRSCCAKLYKSAVIKENHIQFDSDLLYGEDTCFVLDYMGYIKRIRQISAEVYNYRRVKNKKKTARYGLENVNYQWENGLILYQRKTELLFKTGAYKSFRSGADALYLERIRFFMNITVANKCRRKDIIGKLKMIPEEYPDLYTVKIADISHPVDRIICLLAKYRMYHLLYGVFWWKVILYNGVFEWIKRKRVKMKC